MGLVTQQDPIGIAGGLNLYGYANGDPVNFSDPFGLCPFCAAAYALFEVGASIYDAADLAVTGVRYLAGRASGEELGVTFLGAAAGVVGFGGGGGRAARRVLADRATSLPTARIGSAATKIDAHHAFPDIIDNYADDAASFGIPIRGPGGDVVRQGELRQIAGSLNGKDGVFEWVIDDGAVTHRRFKEGAVVDGLIN